jgi:hypothetical protein
MKRSLTKAGDRLLAAGRATIWLFMALYGLSLLATIAGLMNGVAGYAGVFGPLPRTAVALTPDAFPRTVAIIILSGVLFAIAFRFAQLLGGIVDSVAAGDPFTLANADRLRTMAWLALTFQVLSTTTFWRGVHLGRLLSQQALASGDNLSLNGLLLALVLFILARVFRKGSEMREDLAGVI